MSKLVEYIELNERRPAPVETLVEFLTSVMMKDYKMALTLCSEILSYEPNNATAQEFYPLIAEKLEMIQNKSESSESDSTSDSESSCEDTKSVKFSSETSESELSSDEPNEDSRSADNRKRSVEKPRREKNTTLKTSYRGKFSSKSKSNKVSVTPGRTAKTIKDNDKVRQTCKEGRVKAKVNEKEKQENSINIPKEQLTVFGEKLQEPPF